MDPDAGCELCRSPMPNEKESALSSCSKEWVCQVAQQRSTVWLASPGHELLRVRWSSLANHRGRKINVDVDVIDSTYAGAGTQRGQPHN